MSSSLQIGFVPPLCAPDYWVNTNIEVSTFPSMAPGITVGSQAAIQVNVNNNSASDTVTPIALQWVACALNTASGLTAAGIMPSLKPNGRSLALGQPLPPHSGTFATASWIPPASDFQYFFGSSSPWVWEDLQHTKLHVCVFANVYGTDSNGAPDGTSIPDWTAMGAISGNFCADPHHGQLNTVLQKVSGQMPRVHVPFFAGAAGKELESPAQISVLERRLNDRIERSVLAQIAREELDGVWPRPATQAAKLAGIIPVARKEDREQYYRTPKAVVDVKLRGHEIHPHVLTLELDKHEPAGTVHVFDVVQTNGDGKRGGFRLITISTH